jgi:hypothetical protein
LKSTSVPEHLQIGDERVHLGDFGRVAVEVAHVGLGIAREEIAHAGRIGARLRLDVDARLGDLIVAIGHADRAVGGEVGGDRCVIQFGRGEERVAGHHRLRHDSAWIDQVRDVPFVGIFAADAREVRPGALRAPLKRMVVHALGGERIMAVAFDLVAQGADHLRMAQIAALAHVDVAAGKLERRVGPHAVDLLDRALEVEQRRNLEDSTDRDHQQNADDQQDRVVLENAVAGHQRHGVPHSAGWSAMRGSASARSPCRTVIHRL